jgi:hypothetical protein
LYLVAYLRPLLLALASPESQPPQRARQANAHHDPSGIMG